MLKKRETVYPFSTEGFEQCMADIRAEKSRRIINRNVTATFVLMLLLMGAIGTGFGTAAFSYTVYQLIPAVPMPLIP